MDSPAAASDLDPLVEQEGGRKPLCSAGAGLSLEPVPAFEG
jgi:hypothetical protein